MADQTEMDETTNEKIPISTHLNSEDPLSLNAIRALIDQKHEDIYVDYKEAFDPTDEKDWHGITIDTMAFANALGGYVVFGVRDGDFCLVGLSDPSAKALGDTNMVMQKLNRYVAPPFSMIRTKVYTLPSGLVVVVMHIPESKGRTHIFVKDVSYKYPSGTAKQLAYAGMVYVRRSATNQVIQPEDLEDIINRRMEYYKKTFLGNIAKVVEMPIEHQILVFDPNATSESKNTFSISDRPDAIPVKGMSFTTAPQTDVEEICGWIALSKRDMNFQPSEERLWYIYSHRHDIYLTNSQLVEMLRFSLLKELPVFFWMRNLTAEDIGICLLQLLRKTTYKRIREGILETSAFLGSRFNSKIRQTFDGDRLNIGTRCLQSNPSEAFYSKSLLDGDEENSEQRLTELASQLSQGNIDVLQKLRAKALDCRLYARTDKYILQPTETTKVCLDT
jgi:hypothetical protein